MTEIREGMLTFDFQGNVEATKYDGWFFYRKHFQNKCFEGNKAVDFLACDGQTVWLIKVKNYRQHNCPDVRNCLDTPDWPIWLHRRCTIRWPDWRPCKWQTEDVRERDMASFCLHAKRAKVVLHVESDKESRLRPKFIERDNLDKLRRIVKALDLHSLVVCKESTLSSVPWTVSDEFCRP